MSGFIFFFAQDEKKMNPRFVPGYEMNFDTMDEAYEFYRRYTELARVPIKKNRKRNNGQEYNCSHEGNHKSNLGDDRKREKTSERDGCKAMVCAKTAGDGGRAFYTRIVLHHNHKLANSPRMTKRMRAHKVQDPAMISLVDTMHHGHVLHPNIMRVLHTFAGGLENLHLTERDIQNRYISAAVFSTYLIL